MARMPDFTMVRRASGCLLCGVAPTVISNNEKMAGRLRDRPWWGGWQPVGVPATRRDTVLNASFLDATN